MQFWAVILGSRRHRRIAAASITSLSAILLVAALWFGAYPFYTDLRANAKQSDLKQAFGSKEGRTDFEQGRVEEGAPLTRLMVPSLSVDTIVVEGTSLKALAAGAGQYKGTPLPGDPGNVGIAGHRTMNGKPFGQLDRLKPGDFVVLITPFAKHTYNVMPAFDGHANPWVTRADDWTVVAPSNESYLTLTTCHPKGSSRQRLVARAALVGTEPA